MLLHEEGRHLHNVSDSCWRFSLGRRRNIIVLGNGMGSTGKESGAAEISSVLVSPLCLPNLKFVRWTELRTYKFDHALHRD